MQNGDTVRIAHRRRLLAGAVALLLAGLATACQTTPAPGRTTAADGPAAAVPEQSPARFFGPDSFGKLSITMTEREALATGELQTEPVSTVLGKTVYSFVGGPKPDPARMAADEKLEQAVAKADAGTDTSAAGSAKAAKAYADSAQRMVERLEAFLGAGGASFRDGKLDAIAAPAGAVTAAGVKRGSSLAALKAAYAGQGLTSSSKTAYQLPVPGHAGWTVLFELKGDTVQYMSIGRGQP
ncbi:hypothetical protein GCM10020358_66410 [Amorphoplanes nipponensis]|uniref:Lipoprotein n=1 Tax=Actinoplanes nipponensis TaxID=135950 RepID=A0A919MJF1_9ACTN|nr:hypothetical protein [Actinoplanes nipponensis]GIE51754.1 hypothetical protein Ani05nite_52880 [Actinoplanes nipponensis]